MASAAGFAMLADNVARKLAAPAKLDIPGEFIAAAQKWGLSKQWTPTDQRRLFNRPCQLMATRLREAHKFVFDKDFSRLVVAVAEESPQTIARIFRTARLPFEETWIEWDRSSSQDWPEGDQDVRWGALLSPWTTNGDCAATIIFQKGPADIVILPGGLRFNFHRAIETHYLQPTPSDYSNEDEIFGLDYHQRWKARQSAVMKEIGQHCKYELNVAPFGDLLIEMLRQANSVDKAVEEILGLVSIFMAGAFRELICGLALVATHIGGGSLLETKAAKTKTHFYAGKFHPGFEYKVVQLLRPMTAPRLIRRAFPKTAPTPTRWHQVIGAWHHRRATAAECTIHPRACQRAQWQAIFDDDGEPEGIDLQACDICKRRRWYVRDHARGALDLGMLDKGYEVIASREHPIG